MIIYKGREYQEEVLLKAFIVNYRILLKKSQSIGTDIEFIKKLYDVDDKLAQRIKDGLSVW